MNEIAREGRNYGTMPKRHALSERGEDLYETPVDAIRALLINECVPTRVWEPAVGKGALCWVMEQQGISWFGSDIIDYGTGHCHAVHDFLKTDLLRPKVDGLKVEGIITNPPYKHATAFAEKAVATGLPYVALLMRLAFLEGAARGNGLFKKTPPQRVLVFKKRLPMMHRDGWTGPKTSSSTAFAWFIWDRREPAAETVVRWI